MRLNRASAYAVFATLFVAEHQDAGPVQGRAIAEAYGIPAEYLLKILQQLVRARILESETGRRGGFLLRKSPGRVTLLDIVESVEGPLDAELAGGRGIEGADSAKAVLQSICSQVAETSRRLLRQTTIRRLMTAELCGAAQTVRNGNGLSTPDRPV